MARRFIFITLGALVGAAAGSAFLTYIFGWGFFLGGALAGAVYGAATGAVVNTARLAFLFQALRRVGLGGLIAGAMGAVLSTMAPVNLFPWVSLAGVWYGATAGLLVSAIEARKPGWIASAGLNTLYIAVLLGSAAGMQVGDFLRARTPPPDLLLGEREVPWVPIGGVCGGAGVTLLWGARQILAPRHRPGGDEDDQDGEGVRLPPPAPPPDSVCRSDGPRW